MAQSIESKVRDFITNTTTLDPIGFRNKIINDYITTLEAQFKEQCWDEELKLVKTSNEQALETIYQLYSSSLKMLPKSFSIYEIQKSIERAIDTISNSHMAQLIGAEAKFLLAIRRELGNKDKVLETLTSVLKDLDQYREELGTVASIGTGGGFLAFAIGTFYQVGHDIINVFYEIGSYLLQGANAAYDYLSNDVQVDPAIFLELWGAFDGCAFKDGVLEIFGDLKAFIDSIIDSFIQNAEKFGRSIGQLLHSVEKDIVKLIVTVTFEPYDKDAAIYTKVWWAIRQWYFLGTIFGPIVLDILLAICSSGSSGIISASSKIAKLAKIDKFQDSLKMVKIIKQLEALPMYNILKGKLPRSLKNNINKLFDQLWDAISGGVEIIKKWIKTAYKAASNKDELPPLDDILDGIQHIYDKAESVNFFIAIIVLIAGGGINKQGEFSML